MWHRNCSPDAWGCRGVDVSWGPLRRSIVWFQRRHYNPNGIIAVLSWRIVQPINLKILGHFNDLTDHAYARVDNYLPLAYGCRMYSFILTEKGTSNNDVLLTSVCLVLRTWSTYPYCTTWCGSYQHWWPERIGHLQGYQWYLWWCWIDWDPSEGLSQHSCCLQPTGSGTSPCSWCR